MGVYEYKVEGGDDWTALDILIKARELISDPERWTQGAYAKDSSGREVYDSDAAVCWCGIGALRRVAGYDYLSRSKAIDFLHKTAREAGFDYFQDFNDSSTHAEVLAAFDRAIEAARNAEVLP